VAAATPEANLEWPRPPPMRMEGGTGHPQKHRGWWVAGQPVKGLIF